MSKIKLCLIPLRSTYLSMGNPLACEVLAGHVEWYFGESVKVDIIDQNFIGDESLISTLKQLKPNIIGLSAFVGTLEEAKKLIQRIRSESSLSKALILVGNLVGTFAYQEILSLDPEVICVRGHGEIALQQICDVLLRHYNQAGNGLSTFEILNNNCISQIRNLAYKDSVTHEVIITERIPTLPSEVGPTKFNSIQDIISREGLINVRTSYGCPGHCTFCSVREINGNGYHAFSTKRVVDEFRQIYMQGYRKIINITDDNFWGRSLDQMEELTAGLESLKQDVGECIPFKISARADNVINPKDTTLEREQRAKLWKRLAEVGLVGVFIGFESANDNQLRRYGKGVRKDVNYQAYQFLTLELAIRVEIGFIAIDPLMGRDWRETMRDNLAFIKATRMYEYSPAFISEMRALEGTNYLKMLEKHNLKRNQIPGTPEYDYEYLNPEVEQFMAYIEPLFSTRKKGSNPYYMFKNTLKSIKRNGILSQKLFGLSNRLALAEIDFVERLLDEDFNHNRIMKSLFIQCASRILSILYEIKEFLAREALMQNSQLKMLTEFLGQAIAYLEAFHTMETAFEENLAAIGNAIPNWSIGIHRQIISNAVSSIQSAAL